MQLYFFKKNIDKLPIKIQNQKIKNKTKYQLCIDKTHKSNTVHDKKKPPKFINMRAFAIFF